jgi:hypothetical protein
MAAPAPSLTEVILITAKHNAVDMGIVKGVSWQDIVGDIEISGQGDLGDTAIATVARKLYLTATFLASLPIAVDAKGALVLTFTMASGASIVHTFAAMKARGSTGSHQERGELVNTQDFKNESAFATAQHTAA